MKSSGSRQPIEPVSDEVWADIRSQSAERLVGAVANNTPAQYEDLVSLYLWGKPNLSDAQLEAVLGRPHTEIQSGECMDALRSLKTCMFG